MAITRKVLRFGMPLQHLNGVIKRFKLHEKKPVRMIFWRTVQDLCLSLYFITDHPLYLHKIGLITLKQQQVTMLEYYSNMFWLLTSIFDLMCDVVDLYAIQKEIQTAVSFLTISHLVNI